ncbi:MAG: S-methyl-5-thioribose-1-phosphate isomerase [Thermoplasmata archaeon]|nr:S-methyl-5-thioribose-1-phosphate isomerase [Thermoplasmata archaeon]
MAVRALWFDRGRLHLLDQRELPGRVLVRHLRTVEEVAEAIRTLTVRGAPSIGVAAAYGMVLAAARRRHTPASAAQLLGETRPTAHDLFVGIEEVREAWAGGRDPRAAADAYAHRIVDECHRIGEAGASLFRGDPKVLTHCNAGALATVEWGTALAPLRVAHDRGSKLFVWVDETRPLLQGSRLTAWELAQEHIPHAVIADNAAGFFIHRGDVDAVIVGADRIARNGDVANKVGTYEKAVLARENGVPFYVAAPMSTFDATLEHGDQIPIEERGAEEIAFAGDRRLAPRASPVRNPAFDVTPARYVTGFVTPFGVVRAAGLRRLLDQHPARGNAHSKSESNPVRRRKTPIARSKRTFK